MELKWIILSMAVVGLIVYGGLTILTYSTTTQPIIKQTPTTINPPSSQSAVIENGVQKVTLRAMNNGTYSPTRIMVKKGIPVELTFSADSGAGCGQQLVMRDFGVNVIANAGQSKVVSFTPQNAGTFEYACGMRMFRGQLIVTE